METWSNIMTDPVAGLKGLTSNMWLADLKNEGDSNFIIADLKKKLRVYKGAAIS